MSQADAEPAENGLPAPLLGWTTGVLAGIQLIGMSGLVVGFDAVVSDSAATLSPWLLILGAVGVVLVATSRSTLTAWTRLVVAVAIAVGFLTVAPLPAPDAPGVAVLVASALVLAASAVAVVARRDTGRDTARDPNRPTEPMPRHIRAIAYGIPLIVIVGGTLLSIVLGGRAS